MSPGVVVLLVALAAAAAFGPWRALTSGRFRSSGWSKRSRSDGDEPERGQHGTRPSAPGSVLAGTQFSDLLGERATLLQFSSAFCAPCRATRATLANVAGQFSDVAHIEVDAEHHLDLVRRLGIFRTPTTLVLGPDGHEEARAEGAPTPDQVRAALHAVVPE